MSDILAPLTIDFLAWLAAEPRHYIVVMAAWRPVVSLNTVRWAAVMRRNEISVFASRE